MMMDAMMMTGALLALPGGSGAAGLGTGTWDQVLHELTRTRGGASQHAMLGTVAFDLITYFEGMQSSFAASFAEHALIEGKPRLQYVGDALQELRWELLFHAGFCRPELEVMKLRMALQRHEALPLVFASGDFKGFFVPVQLQVTAQQTARDGTMLWAQAQLTLREAALPPVLVEEHERREPLATQKSIGNDAAGKQAQALRRTPTPRPAHAPATRSAP